MSKDRIKQWGEVLENISVKSVKIIFAILMGFLSFGTAVCTYRMPFDYEKEWLFEYPDSPLKNLAAAIAVLILTFFVQKLFLHGSEEHKAKIVFRMALFSVIAVGILLTIWVTVSPIEPYWDQLQVYHTALKFLKGDFSAIDTMFYYRMYVQQFGLILLESLLLNIWQSYQIIQYLNVLFICMIIFLLYRIADHIFHDQTVDFICLAETVLFLPMHLYVTYVYGDICSVALSLAAVWGVIKWEEKGKIHDFLLALFSAIVATLARKNTLIPLIAILIVCVIIFLKSLKCKSLIFGIILLIIPLFSTNAVIWGYEMRSGKEIGNGMPAESWIATGMREQYGGAGTFDWYGESLWAQSPGQSPSEREEYVREISNEYIVQRLEEFRQNPKAMWEFYRYKILEQWGEPSYTSFTMTGKKATDVGSALTNAVYSEAVFDYACRIFNYFQFTVYFFAFCYAFISLRQKEDIKNVLLLIAVIGGFLFSVLWEAKGRYVIPYVVFLFPYAACGICKVQSGIYKQSVLLYHMLQKKLLKTI